MPGLKAIADPAVRGTRPSRRRRLFDTNPTKKPFRPSEDERACHRCASDMPTHRRLPRCHLGSPGWMTHCVACRPGALCFPTGNLTVTHSTSAREGRSGLRCNGLTRADLLAVRCGCTRAAFLSSLSRRPSATLRRGSSHPPVRRPGLPSLPAHPPPTPPGGDGYLVRWAHYTRRAVRVSMAHCIWHGSQWFLRRRALPDRRHR